MITLPKVIKKNQKGIATLEVLIAMALIVLVISAVLPLTSGTQATSIGSQTSQEALYKARNLLEQARATSMNDYGLVQDCDDSMIGSECTGVVDPFYKRTLTVDLASIAQCSKNVAGKVTWNSAGISLSAELMTHLSDRISMVALGGNCDDSPPSLDGWSPPIDVPASAAIAGTPKGIDVFNGNTYIGSDQPPYFHIVDENGALVDLHGFQDQEVINDIKVARLPNGNTYAFVARNVSDLTTEDQLEIIDVTDINNPTYVASYSLDNVELTSPEPHGWRLFYYEERIYILTRYNEGVGADPEFHIINVEDPYNPIELGDTELGTTVDSFVVTKKDGNYFAYMATSLDSEPLKVFQVDPVAGSLTEITTANPVFVSGDYQDGRALFLVGDRLYFGRDSDPAGPDLFVFDVSNPLSGSSLPLLAQADVGISVIGIFASGPLVFLATSQASDQLKIYKSDLSGLTPVSTFNFPYDLINNGVQYEDKRVYTAHDVANSSSAMSILEDSNP